MRILFLTQWFQPENFFKGLPFAKALAARGHDVEVLTGFPNYPGGNIYSGYRIRFYQREVMDGITVHRVPLYPSHDKSALRRSLNYLSFSLSAFFIGPWLVHKPDVIYVYNLVTLGPPAFLMRFLFGSKIIIDVQDIWPESVVHWKMMANKILLNITKKICDRVYRGADRLTVLSPGFKTALISRGVAADKIQVIYNWCDESSIATAEVSTDMETPLPFKGKFVVLFAGSMGIAQGLDTVLDCAKLCGETLPAVHFLLIGGGVDKERLQKLSEDMGLQNVTFLPPRPMEKMGEVYAMADALLVHLKDDPLFRITIPSKTQAYLYTGKPIIMAMRGDAAELVRQAGAGIVCAPEDPNDMFMAIQKLCEKPEMERIKMGRRGFAYYMNDLSFDSGIDKFGKLIASLKN